MKLAKDSLIIKSSIFRTLSDSDETATYVALAAMYNPNVSSFTTCIYDINYILTGSGELTVATKRFFTSGIHKLIEKNIIDAKEDSGHYIINQSSLEITKDSSYIILTKREIQKIIGANVRNSYLILRTFIALLDNFIISKDITFAQQHYGYRCYCNYSLQTLFRFTGIPISTLKKHIRILEDLQIIFTYKINAFKFDDSEQISSFNNIYCRYEDRGHIAEIAAMIVYDSKSGCSYTVKKAYNNTSIAQKLVQVRRGVSYSYEEMKDIFDYVVKKRKAADYQYFTGYDFYRELNA